MLAPPSLAEEWDNCGLQVGNPEAEVGRVLVALTPLPEVFKEAEELDAGFLLFHHPLIFRPLKSLDTTTYPGDLLSRAVRSGRAVYAAHTSHDAAPGGVSVALAEALGLTGPLETVSRRGGLYKLVVFVPEEYVDDIADALDEAGAGMIGDYRQCTFRTPGTGTFLPGDSSDPYLGERGQLEKASEIRLETVVPAHAARWAMAAATEAHPHEEVALDVYPVEGHPEGCGYGRIGGTRRSLNTGRIVRTRITKSRLHRQARLEPNSGAPYKAGSRSWWFRWIFYSRGCGTRRCLCNGRPRLSRCPARGIPGTRRYRRRARRDRATITWSARQKACQPSRRSGRGQQGAAMSVLSLSVSARTSVDSRHLTPKA